MSGPAPAVTEVESGDVGVGVGCRQEIVELQYLVRIQRGTVEEVRERWEEKVQKYLPYLRKLGTNSLEEP